MRTSACWLAGVVRFGFGLLAYAILVAANAWARGPAANGAAGGFEIAKGGTAKAVISVESPRHPSATFAAKELKKYFALMSGASLAVVTNAAKGVAAVRVGGACADTRFEAVDVAVEDAKTLRVTGEGPRGAVYAAYRLLESLGVGFWGPHNETWPDRPTLAVAPGFRLSEAPALKYRQPFGESAVYNPSWGPKVGINGDMWCPKPFPAEAGGHVQMDMSQTMAGLTGLGRHARFPGEHPEWFALRGGKRVGSQLCAQDEGCRAEILRCAREILEKDPERGFLSVSLEDNDQVCQCGKCAKLQREEGTVALALEPANFVARQLAKDYPRLKVLVLAYWITLRPPKTLRPEPNVGVVFGNLDRNYVWAMSGSPRTFAALKRWCEIAPGRVWVWDYDARFHAFPTSLPTVGALLETYREYRDVGVNGVFAQLPHGTFGDFVDLRSWLFAKGTWNPDREWRPLVREWTRGACGKGAPMVEEWIDLLERRRAQMDALSVYGQDSRGIVPPELVIRGYELLNAALAAVKGDARTTRQVQVLRACPMVMLLTRYYLDIAETAAKLKFSLPDRAALWDELREMGRTYRNGSYGEQYDWASFMFRIRHGETILQGCGKGKDKPFAFRNPIAKGDGKGGFARLEDHVRGYPAYLQATKGADCTKAKLPDGRTYRLEASRDKAGGRQVVLRREGGRARALPLGSAAVGGNGAAAFLVVGKRAYVAYSHRFGTRAHEVDVRLLELVGKDPLADSSWKPVRQPLLGGDPRVNGRWKGYGCMNPRFFTSPSGRERWIAYERLESPEGDGRASGPSADLTDPPTWLFMQRIDILPDGSVELGMCPEVNFELHLPDARPMRSKDSP